MVKDIIQQTDPAAAKAMVSGIGTISIFGATINAQELSFWAGILADLGVFAGGIVTVALGIQTFRNSKRNKK